MVLVQLEPLKGGGTGEKLVREFALVLFAAVLVHLPVGVLSLV